MTIPTKAVSEDEWEAAREALLEKEKALTRAQDDLAAERRRLPMVKVEKPYAFVGPDGERSLLDIFDGRSQLIVYRFFYDPGMDVYPEDGCSGCSFFADNVPNLAHLNARDTTMVLASAGSQGNIRRYRTRMGWDIPWYTTADDFSRDFGVEEYFGINVFFRDGDDVYRTYFTGDRAAEQLSSVWSLLDITPYGRQEEWQAAPDGVPQGKPYEWWKLHDRYTAEDLAGRYG